MTGAAPQVCSHARSQTTRIPPCPTLLRASPGRRASLSPTGSKPSPKWSRRPRKDVMTPSSLPIADAGSLRLLARRTRVVRLAFAVGLAATAVSAILLARGPRASAGAFVPAGSNTIVVLDVSQSVEYDKLQLVYGTLTFLGHSKAKVGLVVVSSYAYEALPPGSPASALLPIAKIFRPIGLRSSGLRSSFSGRPRFILPPNPWVAGFSVGHRACERTRARADDHHRRAPATA